MKKIFLKMGFKKADEMEVSIQLKAVRWAWFYTVIFLGVWTVYELLSVGKNPGLPFILLISQNLVLTSLVFYYRRKMVKSDNGEDDEE